jgi:hypothetical protein
LPHTFKYVPTNQLQIRHTQECFPVVSLRPSILKAPGSSLGWDMNYAEYFTDFLSLPCKFKNTNTARIAKKFGRKSKFAEVRIGYAYGQIGYAYGQIYMYVFFSWNKSPVKMQTPSHQNLIGRSTIAPPPLLSPSCILPPLSSRCAFYSHKDKFGAPYKNITSHFFNFFKTA